MNRIHTFHTSVAGIALPSKFTYPFCYTPHPLCVLAAGEVRHYLSGQAGQGLAIFRGISQFQQRAAEAEQVTGALVGGGKLHANHIVRAGNK